MQTVNPWVNNSRGTPVMNGYHMGGHQSPLPHPSNDPTNYGGLPGRQTPRGANWDLPPNQPTGLPLNVATQWASTLASNCYGSWPPNGVPPVSAQNCSPGGKTTSSAMWKSPPPSQQSQWTPVSHEAAYAAEEAKKHNFHGMQPSPQTWGAKVDQMTPWDIGGENLVPATPPNGWSTNPQWNMSQWCPSAGPETDWTGNGGAVGHQNHHPQDDSGWNVSPEQLMATKRHGSNEGASWIMHSGDAPPSMVSNDMMWHDPSVKIKKQARDTGTAIWGDPESQKQHYSEIRHWKNPDNASYGYSAVPPGADWTAVNNDYYQGGQWHSKARPMSQWTSPNSWYDPHDDKQPEMLLPKMAQTVGTTNFFDTLGEIKRIDPTVGKQIFDQFEGAVNRKWVQTFVLKAPLTAEFGKLHQLIKRMFIKENQLLKITTRPATPETSMKKDKLLNEIHQAKNALIEVHRIIAGGSIVTSPITPTDGQSRLRQWKNGNSSKNNCDNNLFQRGGSFVMSPAEASDSMNAILNATNRLSINTDNGDNAWKQGGVDWSPQKSTETYRKSSDETNSLALRIDSQEFIPGKKWEWRDPSKLAEDPNATPGSCKPNPLLSASSSLHLQLNTAPKETSNIMSPNNMAKIQNDWGQRNQSHSSMLPIIVSPNQSRNKGIDSSQYWLLFQLDTISESQFRQICQRAGRVINFSMITPQYACVKFNTSNTDFVIQRIKSEYQFLPEQLRFVSDEEFTKMVKQARTMLDMHSPSSQQSPASSHWRC